MLELLELEYSIVFKEDNFKETEKTHILKIH